MVEPGVGFFAGVIVGCDYGSLGKSSRLGFGYDKKRF